MLQAKRGTRSRGSLYRLHDMRGSLYNEQLRGAIEGIFRHVKLHKAVSIQAQQLHMNTVEIVIATFLICWQDNDAAQLSLAFVRCFMPPCKLSMHLLIIWSTIVLYTRASSGLPSEACGPSSCQTVLTSSVRAGCRSLLRRCHQMAEHSPR